MCVGVLLPCVSTYHMYTHCLKRWEEDVRSRWYCTCRLLCAIMGLLGTNAGSSIRAATVLYCWPISCRTSFIRSSSTICASHFPFNVCPSIECGWPTGVTHLKKTASLSPPHWMHGLCVIWVHAELAYVVKAAVISYVQLLPGVQKALPVVIRKSLALTTILPFFHNNRRALGGGLRIP